MIVLRLFGCVLLLATGLSACMTAAPVRSMALVGGEITAVAPAGYCVDRGASRAGAGFAVIAPCAILGSGDAPPPVLGLATVQVGPADSRAVEGAEAAWRDLLVSDAGAALLSGAGQGETVTVLGAQVQKNAVKVHFTDSAPPPIPDLQAEEWRAFLDMNGRLVTVAVRGLARAPLQDGTGAWLLDAVVGALKNAAAVPAPADAPDTGL